jgi:hypothetical protein
MVCEKQKEILRKARYKFHMLYYLTQNKQYIALYIIMQKS